MPVGLVIWGGGGRIFEWGERPGAGVDAFTERDMSTEDAFKWLLTVPLDTPVIVSGYNCIRRCINIAAIVPDHPERSRVITHMILTPRMGMNTEDVYQLFNRGGGLTQETRVLHLGHPYVEVLTSKADLDMVRGLPELERRLLLASQDDVDAWKSDPEAQALLSLQDVADRVLGAITTARPHAKAKLGKVVKRDVEPLRVQMKRVAGGGATAAQKAPRATGRKLWKWQEALLAMVDGMDADNVVARASLPSNILLDGTNDTCIKKLREKGFIKYLGTGMGKYQVLPAGVQEASKLRA